MKKMGIYFAFMSAMSCLVFSNEESVIKQDSPVFITSNPHTIVDFMKYPTKKQDYWANFSPEAWKFGYYAFNQAPELIPFFARLRKDYRIDTVIETGTFDGGTSVAFSFLFKNVHTIEIQKSTHLMSKEKLKEFSNVQCHLGSSQTILNQLLPSMKGERVLFYLDTHWGAHWPLLEELDEISKTHKDNCIIVIDDFKVPDRPDIPYDKYGTNECSLEYIKEKIGKVFSSYLIEFVIPKSVDSRAKIIIKPKTFVSG